MGPEETTTRPNIRKKGEKISQNGACFKKKIQEKAAQLPEREALLFDEDTGGATDAT